MAAPPADGTHALLIDDRRGFSPCLDLRDEGKPLIEYSYCVVCSSSSFSNRLDPLEELGEMDDREEEDEAPRGKAKAVKKRGKSMPSVSTLPQHFYTVQVGRGYHGDKSGWKVHKM